VWPEEVCHEKSAVKIATVLFLHPFVNNLLSWSKCFLYLTYQWFGFFLSWIVKKCGKWDNCNIFQSVVILYCYFLRLSQISVSNRYNINKLINKSHALTELFNDWWWHVCFAVHNTGLLLQRASVVHCGMDVLLLIIEYKQMFVAIGD